MEEMYFDSTATTQVDNEVTEAMMPYLTEYYGNPSGKYYLSAKKAKEAVEEARSNVSKLIGCKPESLIFTAGATESTNMIIKGYLDYSKYYGDGRNHIVTTTAEHKATLNVCRFLNGEIYSNDDPSTSLFGGNKRVDRGYKASFADVDEFGCIEPKTIENLITSETALVSTIFINNETGSINDVNSIAELCKKRNVAYHVDATQAIGKIDVNVNEIGCDYLSCSAHKIYGPKGIGAAYLKSDNYGIQPITAFIHGGEQEGGFRAGTLAVHNIVGFGKAAEIALRDILANKSIISDLDEYLVTGLLKIGNIRLTNPSPSRLPGIVSIIVDADDFNNERFIKKIANEVAISTGSACSAGEPSHVLKAMGLADKTNKVLRISLSKHSTKQEIDALIKVFTKCI